MHLKNPFFNFSSSQINEYCNQLEEKGYVIIKKIIDEYFVEKLVFRTNDLMMGRIKYEGMFFKLDDPDGDYFKIKHQDVKNEIFSGPSERYKKIKDLEYDDLFIDVIQCDLFKSICQKRIGPEVSSMRSMILNKSTINSSILPFHQDVAENWPMSGKPNFTIWLSLNGADKKKGCLKIVEGSHKYGVIGNGNNLLDTELKNQFLSDKNKIKYLEVDPGDVAIFSNYTLHGSDKNTTNDNRLAFTCCYMDASIYHLKTGKYYPKVFGSNAITKDYIKSLNHKIPDKVYLAPGESIPD
jgi:hypothetical protein